MRRLIRAGVTRGAGRVGLAALMALVLGGGCGFHNEIIPVARARELPRVASQVRIAGRAACAQYLAAGLRDCGLFESVREYASARIFDERPHPSDFVGREILLVSRYNEDQQFHTTRARNKLTLMILPTPIMIPVDFIYIEWGTIEGHYGLEVWTPAGERLAAYATTVTAQLSVQAYYDGNAALRNAGALMDREASGMLLGEFLADTATLQAIRRAAGAAPSSMAGTEQPAPEARAVPSTPIAFCTRCGAKLASEGRFCIGCGSRR